MVRMRMRAGLRMWMLLSGQLLDIVVAMQQMQLLHRAALELRMRMRMRVAMRMRLLAGLWLRMRMRMSRRMMMMEEMLRRCRCHCSSSCFTGWRLLSCLNQRGLSCLG